MFHNIIKPPIKQKYTHKNPPLYLREEDAKSTPKNTRPKFKMFLHNFFENDVN